MPRRQVSAVHRFLSPHQAAVLDGAIGRLVPEPPAHVIAYIDDLLSRFDIQTSARRVRVADLRDQYADGVVLLDQLAGGDFTALPRLSQHLVLSHAEVAPFASMLFGHIVEAIYVPPERLRCSATDRYHETG
jgi:hypothetical protein